MDYPFRYKNDVLHCEQVDLKKFSTSVPTPFFIYSKAELLHNLRMVRHLAGEHDDFLPCYALKANYNPHLLKIIRDEGFGADIVSGGELDFALKSGFEPDKIVFAGVGKTKEEIEKALRADIHSVNIESAQEMETVNGVAATLGKKVKLAIRVNPDIDAQTHAYISTGMQENKFGVSPQEALHLFKKAAQEKYLHPCGVHIHIGSQIEKPGPFKDAARFLRLFSDQLKQEGIDLQFLDIGGGIGINYKDALVNPQKPRGFLADILPEFLAALRLLGLPLVSELGRSIVGSTGLLISKVIYRKETPHKKFLVVDAAMNNLIRPGLYQAYHEIAPLQQLKRPQEKVDVVGPVCESTDFLAKERELPRLEQNEMLAVGGAGAYGQSLSSHYNLRPVIPEYLVDGEKVSCIFKGISIDQLAAQYGPDAWDPAKH